VFVSSTTGDDATRRHDKSAFRLSLLRQGARQLAVAAYMRGGSNGALSIGLEDYTADLGVAKTTEGRESLYARSRLVNAAKALGVQAIDSAFGDVGDMDGLRRWAESSRALGFEGMGCVHPGQIPVIHEAFAPSPAEVEKASKIVAAFDEAQQRGLGVVSLGSKMIDPPVVQRAQKLVELAKRLGKA
jgi:citrate lyase subunit beta/citryl-CoA lyase